MNISNHWNDFENLVVQYRSGKDIRSELLNFADKIVHEISLTIDDNQYGNLSNLFFEIQQFSFNKYDFNLPFTLPPFSNVYLTNRNFETEPGANLEFSVEDPNEYLKKVKSLYRLMKKFDETPYPDFINLISKKIIDLVDADRSIIILIDPETKKINSITGYNYPNTYLSKELTDQVISQDVIGWVIKNRQQYVSKDSQNDPKNVKIARKHAKKFNTGPLIVVPIFVNERIVGTLSSARSKSDKVKYFSQNDVKLMISLAEFFGFRLEKDEIMRNLLNELNRK